MTHPCYYSDPPRHVDTFCTDGGEARYEWTYTDMTARAGIPIGPNDAVVLTDVGDGTVSVTKAGPDYYLCHHHAASWRRQVEELNGRFVDGASAEYELRSIRDELD